MHVSERFREIHAVALRVLLAVAFVCFLLLPSFMLAQNTSAEKADNSQLKTNNKLSPGSLTKPVQPSADSASEELARKIATGHVPRPPIQILRLQQPGAAAVAPFAVAGAHADYFGGPVISNVHI